jgi:3-isopropylmalate/(R)-2-methylmalate dehydratase small subunit
MSTSCGRIRIIRGAVSTDDIIPGRYKHMYVDIALLSKHVFENSHPELCTGLQAGDLLWSDSIFGIGSSREQAPTSLVARGIVAVIAPRFGRIFYRNAWNVGLRLAGVDRLPKASDEAEPAIIDWSKGTLEVGGSVTSFPAPSEHLQAIADAGGLIPSLKLPQNRGFQERGRVPNGGV